MVKLEVGQQYETPDGGVVTLVVAERDDEGSVVVAIDDKEMGRAYHVEGADNLTPIRERITKGGVVFEYTGEMRPARKGEWARIKGWPTLCVADGSTYPREIFKPVAIAESMDSECP